MVPLALNVAVAGGQGRVAVRLEGAHLVAKRLVAPGQMVGQLVHKRVGRCSRQRADCCRQHRAWPRVWRTPEVVVKARAKARARARARAKAAERAEERAKVEVGKARAPAAPRAGPAAAAVPGGRS
mmetsp:Transcript_110759/g.324050  ORF Transcript_110759/g.324050 Transcript_110759/m.324050 type:complete len:126 (-) Transcript_110759:1105-1482(-)